MIYLQTAGRGVMASGQVDDTRGRWFVEGQVDRVEAQIGLGQTLPCLALPCNLADGHQQRVKVHCSLGHTRKEKNGHV